MKNSTRIKLAVLLLVIGLWSFLSFNFRLTNSVSDSFYSTSNAPEFYGLTKAVIKKGDVFSLQDARFRIFAKDFEDGDLTQKILSSSNVNPDSVGTYEIHYSVTDSHNNTTSITVPVEVVDDEETARYYERTMYTLPSVWNMSLAGTNRGNGHDRQILGLYLQANSKIKVKKVSGADNLSLTYLNNDSQTEKSFTITNEYTEITHTYGGVPFIKTSYNRTAPVVIGIEIEDMTGVNDLAYHHEGDSQEEFFNKWSTKSDEYGVLDSNEVTILVPPSDRTKIVYPNQFGKFGSLDEIYKYYDYFINTFDEYLGLSFDPDDSIDQNVRTKYFIKANAHGGGAAYYGGDHVGINSASIYALFEYNWGTLHEVGHGYQGSLAKTGIQMGEVSNNILGHYIQIDKTMFKSNADWLGKIPNIEERYNALRKEGKVYSDYDSYGYGGQLYIFVNLLDTYNSKESYAKVNQIWRRNLRDKTGLTTADAYVLAFYELYNVNITSYFESFGIAVSDNIKEKVSGSETLYFLKDLVGDDLKAQEIKADLGKEGLYSLVKSSDLAKYELKGNMNITLNIDDISEIEGKSIKIQNGSYIHEQKITSNTITINNLPTGTYEIVAPIPKNNVYDYAVYTYVNIVDKGTSEVSINYSKTEIKTLKYDSIISLNGLGNSQFAYISFYNDGKMRFVNRASKPHSYFSDNYATVKVTSANGVTLFEKSFVGNVVPEALDTTVETKVGDKITIMHKEATGRLSVNSSLINKVEDRLKPTESTTTYTITEYGLYKEGLEDTAYSIYKDKVEDYAKELNKTLTQEEKDNKSLASAKKRALYASILELKDTDRYELSTKYKSLYNGSGPTLNETVITASQGAKVNIKELLKGKDVEDGLFELTDKNFSCDRIDTTQAGTFQIGYILTDLDGNKTISSFTLTVNAVNQECPEVPSQSQRPSVPSNVNSNHGSNIDNDTDTDSDEPSVDKTDDKKNPEEQENKKDKNDKYSSKVDAEDDEGTPILVYIYVIAITILLLVAIYLRAKKRLF